MSSSELACNGEPETRAPGAGRALKGLEQMVAGLLRNARTIVLHRDGHASRGAMGAQAHRTFRRGLIGEGAFERLNGVARDIREDPEEMIAVGINDDFS